MYNKVFPRFVVSLISALTLLCSVVGAQTSSTLMGQVTVNDIRILDMTGTYTLAGEGFRLELDVRQQEDGELDAIARLFTDGDDFEGEIGPFDMDGGLWIEREKRLRFDLSGNTNEESDDGPHDDGDNADIFVRVDGVLKSGVFDTDVDIERIEFDRSFLPDRDDVDWSQPLIPANPTRGMVVSDAASFWPTSHGTLQSTRTATLPSGVLGADAFQKNGSNGKVSILVDAGYLLQLTVNAKSSAGAFVITKAKILLPYGRLKVRPEQVTVLPSAGGVQ